MFWDNWIPARYSVKSEVCAVEVCFTEERKIYYYTHLRNKKNKLELLATGSNEDSLQLPNEISKNKIPLVLVINGKGIILKKTSLSAEGPAEIEDLIRQNLPAINLENFYAEVYKQDDNSAFIALCRREQLKTLISEFKNRKYELGEIFLGVPAIIGLQPLWKNFNAISVSTHQVEITNNNLDAITPLSDASVKTISIEDLSFNTNYALGFAGGLSYLLRRHIVETDAEELKLIKTQHYEKNKFRFLNLVGREYFFFYCNYKCVFLYVVF